MSVRKARRLLKEAELDLAYGNFNKCASAAYFSVRMMAEVFLLSRRLAIPRRDDKLANLVENIGLREVALSMRRLYDLRKKADYFSQEVSEEEAREALDLARKSFEALEDLLDQGGIP